MQTKFRHSFVILLLLLIIFLINAHGILNGWNYWFFELEHVICGFLLAMLFSSYFSSRILILLTISILGILWEYFEYAVSHISLISKYFKGFLPIDAASLTWPDIILDMILNLAGVFLFLSFKKNKRG